MPTVKSEDGTTIAYDRQGSGPALMCVDGTLGSRSMGFGSEAVEREVEDIEALIDEAGGSTFVFSDFFCTTPAGGRR